MRLSWLPVINKHIWIYHETYKNNTLRRYSFCESTCKQTNIQTTKQLIVSCYKTTCKLLFIEGLTDVYNIMIKITGILEFVLLLN